MTARFAIALFSSVLLLTSPLACSDDAATGGPGVPPAADTATDAAGQVDPALTTDGAAAHDTGLRPSDSGADGADGGTGCHAHPNNAPAIGATVLAQPMPAPAGGVIADGTYQLTSVTYYAGADAATPPLTEIWKQTVVIEGKSFAIASARDSNPEQRALGTFATEGTIVTFTESCPKAQANEGHGFTATGSELRITVTKDERVLGYSRQ